MSLSMRTRGEKMSRPRSRSELAKERTQLRRELLDSTDAIEKRKLADKIDVLTLRIINADYGHRRQPDPEPDCGPEQGRLL